MHHMQNVNSHKQQYQKPISPLSSIPEIHQKGPSLASNLQNNAPDNAFNSPMDKHSPSVPKSSDPPGTNNDTQNKNNLEEVDNADSTSISNVMEDLINVAESVVASRQSTNAPFGNPENVIKKEELKKDASKCYYICVTLLFTPFA